MTKADLEDVAIRLLVIVKRNVTDWERHFSDKEVREIRKIWNTGLAEGHDGYWY